MDVLEQSLALNDTLRSSPLFQAMKQAENAMLMDKDVTRLIVFYQTAQENYNYSVRLSLDNLEKTQKELAQAKKNLDEHPLVLTYQHHFNQLKRVLRDISHDLFDEFNLTKHGNSCSPKK